MKYGAGGCAHRWCRALLPSAIEPENTVLFLSLFHFVTECRITQYIPLILPKPTTHTSRRGWIHQQQILFTVCSRGEVCRSQTQIFPGGKKQQLGFDCFTITLDLPWRGLGQTWRGWKERGQSLQKKTGVVVAPRVKFIDCRRFHLHPYLWKHRCPYCWEAQFWWRRAQNGERHEWVGWQRATGSAKKKEKKKDSIV